MNRRQLIRTAVGIGAGTALMPVVVERLAATGNQACNSVPAGCQPVYKEPPLDTRTPEQIVADAEKESVNQIIRDLTADYHKYHRFTYRIDAHEFRLVRQALTERNISFEERVILGSNCIIANGNVLRNHQLAAVV